MSRKRTFSLLSKGQVCCKGLGLMLHGNDLPWRETGMLRYRSPIFTHDLWKCVSREPYPRRVTHSPTDFSPNRNTMASTCYTNAHNFLRFTLCHQWVNILCESMPRTNYNRLKKSLNDKGNFSIYKIHPVYFNLLL